MNAEDFAKTVIELYFPQYKDDAVARNNLSKILRAVHQWGHGTGEDELRKKVSVLLGSPTLSVDEIKNQLASILSRMQG